MAVIDKGVLIDQAQKFVQKGLIDKAISEYQKVVEADPRDLRTHLKIAELYLKKGNKVSAITEYNKAAELYTSDGFNLQAIAVYKQVLKIDPSIYDIYIRLADLYKKQGLIADALAQYKIVIGNYEKVGKAREVIDTLRQMASIDPENFSIRLKLAELYLKNGDKREALEEYSIAAEELEKKGRIDDAIILYQRLLSADPTYSKALTSLGSVYLKAGKRGEAVSQFKTAIEKNPNDLRALLLLGGVYADSGDLSNARQIYEKAVQADPSSADARKGLFRILANGGDYKVGIDVIMPVVDKALAEKSYDGALGILFEFYRNNLRVPVVLEKMAEAYGLKGEKNKETEIRGELERLKGGGGKKEAEPEILEIEEANIEELPLEELHEEEAPLEEHFIPTGKPPAPPSPDVIARSLTEAEVYLKYGLADKAIETLLVAAKASPGNIELHKGLKVAYERVGNLTNASAELVFMADIAVKKGGTSEAIGYLEEALKLNPGQEDAVRMLASLKKPHLEEVEEVSLEVEMPEEASFLDKGEESHISKIAKELEEADFYIQQGLYGDAKDICNRTLDSHPDNREALLKLKAIDEAMAATAPVKSPVEKRPEEAFFDLAAELTGEEFEALATPPGMREAEKFGFEDIFSEFKKGVESQLEREDTETHYNLGIAYKEMGLFDDAVREFNIAAAEPKKQFDSYNLIGICYIEKGDSQKAVEFFKKSLKLPGISKEEYASMNYELGQAYELAGMTAEAAAAYTETQKMSPGFRDVEAKIASLGAGREVKKRRVSFV